MCRIRAARPGVVCWKAVRDDNLRGRADPFITSASCALCQRLDGRPVVRMPAFAWGRAAGRPVRGRLALAGSASAQSLRADRRVLPGRGRVGDLVPDPRLRPAHRPLGLVGPGLGPERSQRGWSCVVRQGPVLQLRTLTRQGRPWSNCSEDQPVAEMHDRVRAVRRHVTRTFTPRRVPVRGERDGWDEPGGP